MKIYLILLACSLLLGGLTGAALKPVPSPAASEGENQEQTVLPVPAVINKVNPHYDLLARVDIQPGKRIEFFPDYRDAQNFTYIVLTPGQLTYGHARAGRPVNNTVIQSGIEAGTRTTLLEVRGFYCALYADRTFIADIPLNLTGECSLGLGRAIDPAAIQYTPVVPPFLKDDFMRVEGEAGAWKIISGDWGIKTMKNPSMSANAFSFQGQGTDGMAIIGKPGWNNYTFELSLNFPSEGEVGIITGYRSQKDYDLVSWSASRIRMRKIRDGKTELIKDIEKGFIPGQWYRISGTVSRHIFSLNVDGHPIINRSENEYRAGSFGVYVNSGEYAYFDDAEIRELQVQPLHAQPGGILPFETVGGKWQAGDGMISGTADREAKGVWGLPGWSNYEIRTELSVLPKGEAGIGLYYSGDENYYLARVDFAAKALKLIAHQAGQEKELFTAALSFPEGKILPLSFGIYNGVLTVRSGTTVLGNAFSRVHRSGRPFLWCRDAFQGGFADTAIVFQEYIEPVRSENEIFTAEYSMAEWAGSRSDWLIEKEQFKGRDLVTLWNKASVPGDVLMEADIEDMVAEGKIRLMLAADERRINSGYSFGLNRGEKREVLLMRGDQVVERASLENDRHLYRIGFQKIGNTLLGLLDDRIVLSYIDSEGALSGTNAGWVAAGKGITREDVWTYSDSLFDYKFTRSPSEWRVGSGTWEVTNRWQCDPRWTFFSGYTDKGPAVIWNKREFKGDVTVEFYAGIKMNREKGNKYQYASDINCVIGGNGQQTSSGYNFIFGGFKNSRTCITRGKEVVAETRDTVIPVSLNIHRRWFYIRVEKRGDLLTYFIDGRKILTFKDPQPLSGSRIGFWTYDNGIMVARVRISSEDGLRFEGPLENWAGEGGTIYDDE